jgi:hypothetical protein
VLCSQAVAAPFFPLERQANLLADLILGRKRSPAAPSMLNSYAIPCWLRNRWGSYKTIDEQKANVYAVVNIFVEGLRILAEGRSVSACGGTVRLGCELKRVPVKQETSLETSSNAA